MCSTGDFSRMCVDGAAMLMTVCLSLTGWYREAHTTTRWELVWSACWYTTRHCSSYLRRNDTWTWDASHDSHVFQSADTRNGFVQLFIRILEALCKLHTYIMFDVYYHAVLCHLHEIRLVDELQTSSHERSRHEWHSLLTAELQVVTSQRVRLSSQVAVVSSIRES